jgi:hypothetical protein
MPESKWVRVKDDTTGHEYSICRDPFDGETVIDKPAANLQDEPLPAKPNVNMARRKPPEPPEPTEPTETTTESTPAPDPEPTTPTGAPSAATSNKEKVK